MRRVETALKHEHSAQTVREPPGWGEHVTDGRMISGEDRSAGEACCERKASRQDLTNTDESCRISCIVRKGVGVCWGSHGGVSCGADWLANNQMWLNREGRERLQGRPLSFFRPKGRKTHEKSRGDHGQ